MKFSLARQRIDSIPKEKIVDELKRVAKHFKFRRFSGREFDEVSALCKRSCVLQKFKSWENALAATGFELKPHRNKRRDTLPKVELFVELERVWRLLGHRPSKIEWEAINPKYSYTTYKARFNGWINACAEFIDFKSNENAREIKTTNFDEEKTSSKIEIEIREEEKRNIPLKLRLEVLKRDQFRCVFCGRTPATEAGVVLHIDHKVAFSKGGKTTIKNLQCLCANCNLGKGKEIV